MSFDTVATDEFVVINEPRDKFAMMLLERIEALEDALNVERSARTELTRRAEAAEAALAEQARFDAVRRIIAGYKYGHSHLRNSDDYYMLVLERDIAHWRRHRTAAVRPQLSDERVRAIAAKLTNNDTPHLHTVVRNLWELSSDELCEFECDVEIPDLVPDENDVVEV